MGRAVFADADAIMSKNINDADPHQRRQANRRPNVIGKNEESGAERE